MCLVLLKVVELKIQYPVSSIYTIVMYIYAKTYILFAAVAFYSILSIINPRFFVVATRRDITCCYKNIPLIHGSIFMIQKIYICVIHLL